MHIGIVGPGDLYNDRPGLALLNIVHSSRDVLVSALITGGQPVQQGRGQGG